MKISKLAIAWKAVAGFLNPFSSAFESVADYVLGIANNFVASLDAGKVEKLDAALATANGIYEFLKSHSDWCPKKWENEFAKTISAFKTVVDALTDKELTTNEVKEIAAAWKIAYSEWMSDESVDVEAEYNPWNRKRL